MVAVPTPTSILDQPKTYAEIAETLRPSVVRIQSSGGTGTGFIIHSNGSIVTNAHVVGNDLFVDVELSSGVIRRGRVLGRNQSQDLAVLVIDGYQLPVVELNASERPKVGDEVVAMGYALDLPGTATFTRGMVSAFRADMFGSLTALQTDTAINPGNSGGPLVDLNGRVVGVNTAGALEAVGINFAIVMDEAVEVIEHLTAGETLNGGRFVSDFYPFTITLPEGWRAYQITSSQVYFRHDQSGAAVIIDITVLPTGVTSVQFATSQIKLGADQDFEFYEKDATRNITLATLPAWEVTERWKRPENDFSEIGVEYFVATGGNGYSLYTQSPSDEWNNVKDVVAEIIDSFTIDLSVSNTTIVSTETPIAVPSATSQSVGAGVYFGPVDGTLEHTPDDNHVPGYDSETTLVDSVIEATFVPPHYEKSRLWSLGFVFRNSGPLEYHVLAIRSNGYWYHRVRKGDRNLVNVDSRHSQHISVSEGSTNHVRVLALGDVGSLFINGNYVSELDLSGWSKAGSVSVIGAWFADDEYSGEATIYREFTVRSLQIASGPISDSIPHILDDGLMDAYSNSTSIRLRDTVVQANFKNPYSTDLGKWSPGFMLRHSKSHALHSIGVGSRGNWYHYVGQGTVGSIKRVTNKLSSYVDTSPTGINFLRIIALGDRGWFFVNRNYVAELDLSDWTGRGNVQAFANHFYGHGLRNNSTEFDQFVIWSVGKE